MGFWSNLQAASTTSNAASFIDKYMQAATAAGLWARPPGGTRKMAEHLVMSLWSSTPALAQQTAKPKAVLVAAAALAHGIQHFDSQGKRDISEKLFPCLRALLADSVPKHADLARLAPIDSQLFDLATSVLEPPGSQDKPQQTVSPPASQATEAPFNVTPSMPDLKGTKPASCIQIGDLYLVFFAGPQSRAKRDLGIDIPIAYMLAAALYDRGTRRLLRVFTLESGLTATLFFCAFERTGGHTNLGDGSKLATLSAFEAAVVAEVCKSTGLSPTSAERLSVDPTTPAR
jgi:hypothetical protein